DLTDAQWARLDSLIPEPQRRKDGRGRPWRGRREALNGILFILRTGAAWADLPACYPPYQTCHRRFQQWVRSGIMLDILESVAEEDFISKKPGVEVIAPHRGSRKCRNELCRA